MQKWKRSWRSTTPSPTPSLLTWVLWGTAVQLLEVKKVIRNFCQETGRWPQAKVRAMANQIRTMLNNRTLTLLTNWRTRNRRSRSSRPSSSFKTLKTRNRVEPMALRMQQVLTAPNSPSRFWWTAWNNCWMERRPQAQARGLLRNRTVKKVRSLINKTSRHMSPQQCQPRLFPPPASPSPPCHPRATPIWNNCSSRIRG